VVLLVPAAGASLQLPLTHETSAVVLTTDTVALEGQIDAWTLGRSDMWWKPETDVRAHLRAFLGGRLSQALVRRK